MRSGIEVSQSIKSGCLTNYEIRDRKSQRRLMIARRMIILVTHSGRGSYETRHSAAKLFRNQSYQCMQQSREALG
jgi:hypothetical protein